MSKLVTIRWVRSDYVAVAERTMQYIIFNLNCIIISNLIYIFGTKYWKCLNTHSF